MKMGYNPTMNATRTVTIELGELGSFQVTLRRPTWQERRDDENFSTAAYAGSENAWGAKIEHRLNVVVDWKDLLDDKGNQRPFDMNFLKAMCAELPDVFVQIEKACDKQFVLMPETERKNSPSPSSDSSGEAGTATQQETSLQS
jgi:hypothetical protein